MTNNMSEYEILWGQTISKVSKSAPEGTRPWVFQGIVKDLSDGAELLVVVREDYPHEFTKDGKILLPHAAARNTGMLMGAYVKGGWLKPE